MKKIIKIVFIILVIFFCSIITIVMLTADKNLDGAPPKELTKQYELYAKDVNWKNIIINKKNDFVKEKEMSNRIEITDFTAPELDVYARIPEVQLLRFYEPKPGLFIAESPKVIQRAANHTVSYSYFFCKFSNLLCILFHFLPLTYQ